MRYRSRGSRRPPATGVMFYEPERLSIWLQGRGEPHRVQHYRDVCMSRWSFCELPHKHATITATETPGTTAGTSHDDLHRVPSKHKLLLGSRIPAFLRLSCQIRYSLPLRTSSSSPSPLHCVVSLKLTFFTRFKKPSTRLLSYRKSKTHLKTPLFFLLLATSSSSYSSSLSPSSLPSLCVLLKTCVCFQGSLSVKYWSPTVFLLLQLETYNNK